MFEHFVWDLGKLCMDLQQNRTGDPTTFPWQYFLEESSYAEGYLTSAKGNDFVWGEKVALRRGFNQGPHLFIRRRLGWGIDTLHRRSLSRRPWQRMRVEQMSLKLWEKPCLIKKTQDLERKQQGSEVEAWFCLTHLFWYTLFKGFVVLHSSSPSNMSFGPFCLSPKHCKTQWFWPRAAVVFSIQK